MTTRSGTRQGRRWQWPLLGFLLIVLMLGHDALMAADALVAPHRGEATHHPAQGNSVRDDVRPAHHDPDSLPAHPDQCSVSIEALVRNPDDAAHMAQYPRPVAQATVKVARAPRWNWAAWQEPHWPPGRLRAVTQVYRI